MIKLAVRVLDARFGLARASGLFATPAWPNASDPPFVNAAAALASAPSPIGLLAALHEIEAAFGRRRTVRNAPRTLDLDLLAFGELESAQDPILPHPGLFSRDFVLAPLAEIAPDFSPPGAGRSVLTLLHGLDRVSAVRIGG